MLSFTVMGSAITGELRPSGSKLCIPALFGLAILANAPLSVHGAPESSDMQDCARVLRGTMRPSGEHGRVEIHIQYPDVPSFSGSLPQSRTTLPLLGLLATRRGHVELPAPRGCGLGTRPIDAHIELLDRFGLKSALRDGVLSAKKVRNEPVRRIRVPRISSGASVQAILLAVIQDAESPITVTNLYGGMEIRFLLESLRDSGFIEFTRQPSGLYQMSTLPPTCRREIKAVTVPQDSIELASWVVASLTLGGIFGGPPDSSTEFANLARVLQRGGAPIHSHTSIQLDCIRGAISAIGVISTSQGIHTDLIPMLAVLASQVTPMPTIIDTVFRHRQAQADALLTGRFPRRVVVEDIRSGFAKLIGALLTYGLAEVDDPEQLLPRGYPGLTAKMERLGLRIEQLSVGRVEVVGCR